MATTDNPVQSTQVIKEYSTLKFTDDFMFWKTLTTNKDICKKMLEMFTGLKIRKMKYVEGQKEFKHSSESKGVRFDVYAENDDSVYDIEMQTTLDPDLSKRMRYYQDTCDMDLIKKGQKYNVLKKMYIIFICLSDPFNARLPVYTFKSTCQESKNILFGDDVTKIVINTSGDTSKTSKDIAEFIEYINSNEPTNKLTKKIDDVVRESHNNKEWREEYMLMSYTYQKQQDEVVKREVKKAVKENSDELTLQFLKTTIRLLVAEGHDFNYIYGVIKPTPNFSGYQYSVIKKCYEEVMQEATKK